MPQAKISQPRRWSGSPSPPLHSNSSTPIFARLPVEINLAIISLFCKHCSLQDPRLEYPSSEHHNDQRHSARRAVATLSALSKTCKWLQLQAQPILHHHFPGSHDCDYDCYEAPHHRHQFYLFVRTLSSRPDLASAVRCLGLVEGTAGLNYGVGDRTESKKQIVRTALHCGLKPPSSWFSKPFKATSFPNNRKKQTDKSDQNLNDRIWLDSGTHAFLIRLALHLCGNARVINVSGLGNSRGRINFHPTSASDIFFKNLQTFRVNNQAAPVSVGCVRIHGDMLDNFYGPQPSIDLRQLAGLTVQRAHTLHVCLAFLPRWLQNSAGSESNSPSASELALHHDPAGLPLGLDLSLLTCLELVLCVMTGKHLAMLLSGCVNLIDLTYVSVPFHTAVGDPDVHTDHVAQAPEISNIIHRRCSALHRTLRRLALDHITNDEESYYGVYTSLQNLVSLEEIYLGANGLFTTLEDCRGPELDGNPPNHPVALTDILPPNIVSLDIFEVGEWKGRVSNAIADLLHEMKDNSNILTGLKEIRVWEELIWDWLDNYPRRDEFNEPIVTGEVWDPGLEDLATTVGVKFCIEPRPAPHMIRRLQRSESCRFDH